MNPATSWSKAVKRLLLPVASLLLFSTIGCHDYTTGLQKSVERADETSAIAALRNISTAERTFSVTNNGEYATLQQLTDAGLMDSRFAQARPLRDYILALNVSTGSFSCNADPDPSKPLQGRHLYVDSTSGEIHVNPTQPATASDPALQ